MDFRIKLEAYIKEKDIPNVLIVLEGGLGTLKTTRSALECKTPVILIAVCK